MGGGKTGVAVGMGVGVAFVVSGAMMSGRKTAGVGVVCTPSIAPVIAPNCVCTRTMANTTVIKPGRIYPPLSF
jgi:hypothetical protein